MFLTTNNRAFSHIVNGSKKIEGRLIIPKGYIDNIINLYNNNILKTIFIQNYNKNSIEVIISKIIIYNSLNLMVKNIYNNNIHELLPYSHINTVDKALDYYKKIYSTKNINNYKGAAIYLIPKNI